MKKRILKVVGREITHQVQDMPRVAAKLLREEM